MDVFDYIEKELDRIEVGYTSYDGTNITLSMDEVRELIKNIKKKYKPDGDTIYRKAAIDGLNKLRPRMIDTYEKDGDCFLKVRVSDVNEMLEALPSAQSDTDMVHLQKEQAYMQGWEDGRKALRKEIWEDGRDMLD